jgi:hypothetical protein
MLGPERRREGEREVAERRKRDEFYSSCWDRREKVYW